MFTQFEWRQQHRKATHGAVVIDLSDTSTVNTIMSCLNLPSGFCSLLASACASALHVWM